MTEQTTKDAPAAKDAAAAQDGADALAADLGSEDAAPAGHPAPAIIPQVSPEAAPRPKRDKSRKGGATRTLVYGGPADVFTFKAGDPGETKFRPGVPTEIGADDADELLTYPNHQFVEAAAEADGLEEAKEQDDGG